MAWMAWACRRAMFPAPTIPKPRSPCCKRDMAPAAYQETPSADPSSEAEQSATLINREADQPGQDGHVGKQERGPAKASGLAPDHGQRAHALAGQREKDHEGQPHQGREHGSSAGTALGADAIAQAL